MKTDHIKYFSKNDDILCLMYDRKVKTKLDTYLSKFDLNDYYCFKGSWVPRLITEVNDLKTFKYSDFIFFKKEKYSLNDIYYFINFLINNEIKVKYIHTIISKNVIDGVKIIDEIY